MQNKHLTMHDLPADDRPYEKLLLKGAAALSDAELIAVIMRSGSRRETALGLAQRLLHALSDQASGADAVRDRSDTVVLRRLRDSSVEELTALPGIGRVKAVQLQAALELGSRVSRGGYLDGRRQVRRPSDVISDLGPDMAALPREELRTVLLDVRQRVIRVCRVGEGGLSGAVIHPRDLFREAVKANAAALILAHNHPSGDASPSAEDIETTRKLVEIGKMMGIQVLDHLVLAAGGSVSLREQGLI